MNCKKGHLMLRANSRTTLVLMIGAALLMSTALVFMKSNTAYAAGRTAPRNATETDRKAQCSNPAQTANIFGAVWINDTAASSTGNDRWDEGIVVPWNATTVTVRMWTTAFVCSDLRANVNNAEIYNLNDLASSPVPILSFSSTSIQRGDATPGTFTDRSAAAGEQIGVITIRIDVTGFGNAGGGRSCYADAVQFQGRYRDADRSGLSTVYRQDLCITRQARPWSSTDYVNIYQRNPATNAIISGPLGTSRSATPGQRYSFNYTVKNDGPGPTTSSITAQRTYTYPAASQGWTNYSTRAAGVPDNGNIFNAEVGNTGVIPASALGSRYCLTMRYRPFSGTSGSAYNTSPEMCVNVPFSYDLHPTVTASASSVAQGQPITFSHTMDNTGSTASPAVAYAVKQFIVPPGQAFNTGVGELDNSSDTDPRYGTSITPQSQRISPDRAFPLGTSTVPEAAALLPVNTASLAPGTRICRILTVDPAQLSPNIRNRYSAPACVYIGKQPYVTIKDGDGFAGGSFARVLATSTCPTSGQYAGGFRGRTTTYSDGSSYGSFGEYQLFSLAGITQFGSAGQPLSRNFHYRGSVPEGFFYTSSIAGVPSQTRHCMGDAQDGLNFASAINLSSSPSVNISTMNGMYTKVGDLDITANPLSPAGTIAPNQHVIIRVTGNVTLRGDIAFSARDGGSDYTSIARLPSVTIIATGNIQVSQTVTRLDGLYQAYGFMNTCLEGGVSGGIGDTQNICDRPLVVNGAASAGKFELRRIYGAESTARNEIAEQFIYRPDLVLSSYIAGQSTQQVKTVSEREIPARY